MRASGADDEKPPQHAFGVDDIAGDILAPILFQEWVNSNERNRETSRKCRSLGAGIAQGWRQREARLTGWAA